MNAKIKKSINLLLRTMIVLATYGFLFYELFVKNKFSDLNLNILDTNLSIYILGVVFFLMPLNWGLESIKWQFLIRKVEKIRVLTAFKAVLTGSAISFFTPNRIGDFFGRVFILKKGDRIDGIFATIIGNIGQLFITLILGSTALLFFLPNINNAYLNFNNLSLILIAILVILINLSLVLVFLNIGILHTFFSHFKFLERWRFVRHLKILQNFETHELWKVLGLSLLRFLVYSFQFYLVFYSFGIPLPFLSGLLIIFILFFTLTTVPTIAIAELGIRGLISLFVLKTFGPAELSINIIEANVIAASSALWLINLAIPAIFGTFFVYELKFFRKND
ncbi:MAG: flippase-like domain-containing protein [Bacteroidales bacterium]|nr:flippase-like domain-containing protein [Bacteroidales bacterium]